MSYGSRSNTETDPHGHWSKKYIDAGRHNLADVGFLLEETREYEPLNTTWKALRSRSFSDSLLIRCYLNGYTFGTDGYFDSDSHRADEHTAIIYITDNWDPDWAGETVFLDAAGEIIKSVLPRKNRAVIFPAHQLHAARGVSRKCNVLRETLIFKVRKKRTENFERLSAFLANHGAVNLRHRRGTLHDHLVRSFAILEKQGATDHICFGAGLHSIYGTLRHARMLLGDEERAKVALEFGQAAEQLAHLFSILDRPRTLEDPRDCTNEGVTLALSDGNTLTVTEQIFDELRLIECANLIDQKSLDGHVNLGRFWALKK